MASKDFISAGEKPKVFHQPNTLPFSCSALVEPHPIAAFIFPFVSTLFQLLPGFALSQLLSLLRSQAFPLAPPATHSSESRSLSSLFLSLKQPRECMLSRTSGSMSSAEGRLRMVTFLGTGCSGSGSFFPPLRIGEKKTTKYSHHQWRPRQPFILPRSD